MSMRPLAVDSAPCACSRCESMCRFAPGWPAVEEAAQLLDAGYGPRMMLDWWNPDGDLPYTEILCPATVGDEGGVAPPVSGGIFAFFASTGKGTCTLLKAGKCEIYGVPGRPVECRAARHDVDNPGLHRNVAATWNSEAGRALVARWKAEVGYTGSGGDHPPGGLWDDDSDEYAP